MDGIVMIDQALGLNIRRLFDIQLKIAKNSLIEWTGHSCTTSFVYNTSS